MSECGATEFLKGGAISEADIVSSRISNSSVVGCAIESAHMTNLSSIDELSAQRIADAIAVLPTAQITALAQALAKALVRVHVSNPPETNTDETLPTAMFGDRGAILGTPVVWLDYHGHAVPAYSKPV